MADRRVVRIAEVGKPAFQLRKGEEGISVFDPSAVNPNLTESEILEVFRGNSQLVERTIAEIEERGLAGSRGNTTRAWDDSVTVQTEFEGA